MDRHASLLTEINPDHCPRLARIGKVNCTEDPLLTKSGSSVQKNSKARLYY